MLLETVCYQQLNNVLSRPSNVLANQRQILNRSLLSITLAFPGPPAFIFSRSDWLIGFLDVAYDWPKLLRWFWFYDAFIYIIKRSV